jgi:hypothetical protein
MDFSLLFAVRVGRTARLFRTNRGLVNEEHDRWCMGVGVSLAYCLLDLLLEKRPPVDVAAPVAAFVVKQVMSYAKDVGYQTDVHVICSDGGHWSLRPKEIATAETQLIDVMASARKEIYSVAIGEAITMSKLSGLKDSLAAFGVEQKRRRAARLKRLTQPDPQLPTDDPPPQPPLPG